MVKPSPMQANKSEMGSLISERDFTSLMQSFGSLNLEGKVAVAVSGGPDSMALVRLANIWAKNNCCAIIGLTVDHQLRDASSADAKQVAAWFTALGLSHHTLVWARGPAVGQLDRSPQAEAREARFALMIDWCRSNDVHALMVAHHADDQAETFIQRLLRGSGIDGLAAMRSVNIRDGIRILRPLLHRPKADLIATCEHFDQAWLRDPSNQDEKFMRVRVRRLLEDLDAEGLGRDRLLNTVAHMQRAKEVIDSAVDQLWADAVETETPRGLLVNTNQLLSVPKEIGLRCLARSLKEVSGAEYPPRFDSLMLIYSDLETSAWSDRTLQGCQLRREGAVLMLTKEARERRKSY